MTPPPHDLHYLTLAVVGSRRGWVAPVELPQHNQQAAAYVVPIDEGGGLFPRYRLECAKYLGQGSYQIFPAVMDLTPSGFLKALINGWSIRLQLRRVGGQLVVHEYVGRLNHPDFTSPLAEIEPEDEEQLQDLYSQEQIAIVGCDPLTQYRGAAILGQTSPPRVG